MLDSLKLMIVNGGELPSLPNRFFHYVKKPLSFLAAQTGSAPPGNNIRNYGSANFIAELHFGSAHPSAMIARLCLGVAIPVADHQASEDPARAKAR